jgi:SM-20-related protein
MENLQLPDELCAQLKRQKIIEELVQQRYSINPDYLEADLVVSLQRELIELAEQDRLRAAYIGKDEQRTRIRTIRGDAIHWLNGATKAQRHFLELMEQLQQDINQELFLGLNELEAHFAHYPPGTGYQQHLDSFQNNNQRRITIVAYLNPVWHEDDGGELEIFDGEMMLAKVAPLGGTLACFVSEEIPHQVAITHVDRYSIAGWFRVRDPELLPG